MKTGQALAIYLYIRNIINIGKYLLKSFESARVSETQYMQNLRTNKPWTAIPVLQEELR